MAARGIISSIMVPIYFASDDKENVDPHGPGLLRNAPLVRTAQDMALINPAKGGEPDPEPSSAKSRHRRYPLQDITAIIYPSQANTYTGGGYGSNKIPTSYSGNPRYQHASPRSHGAERSASVSYPKKQAVRVKKHRGASGLESQAKTEHSVHDSISAEAKNENVKKKTLKRRHIRRGRAYFKICKSKAGGEFTE